MAAATKINFKLILISRLNSTAPYRMSLKAHMIHIISDWQHIFEDAPLRGLELGMILFQQVDCVRLMDLVRSGEIALELPVEDGTALPAHVATAGNAMAEASLFADASLFAGAYHCDAVVRSPAQIATMPRADFLSALRDQPSAALN